MLPSMTRKVLIAISAVALAGALTLPTSGGCIGHARQHAPRQGERQGTRHPCPRRQKRQGARQGALHPRQRRPGLWPRAGARALRRSHRPLVGRRRQNELSGPRRNAISSGVDTRPRMALRCGKRPKRSMMTLCASAQRTYSSPSGREQLHAACLQAGILGVLERQIEELPPLRRQPGIEPARDRALARWRAPWRPSRRRQECRGTCCARTGRARWSRPARCRASARQSSTASAATVGVEG